MATVSNVLRPRWIEWIASRNRVRVDGVGDVKRLLWLRGSSISRVGLRCLWLGVVVHRAVWWALVWRRAIHGRLWLIGEVKVWENGGHSLTISTRYLKV